MRFMKLIKPVTICKNNMCKMSRWGGVQPRQLDCDLVKPQLDWDLVKSIPNGSVFVQGRFHKFC